MTPPVDIDTRRALGAQRTAAAVMLGITVAGFYEDLTFFVLTIHALVWTSIFLLKASAIRELDIVLSDHCKEDHMKKI